VIVHVGFAISQLDEEEAMKTLEMLRAIDAEACDGARLDGDEAADSSSAAPSAGLPAAPPRGASA